MANLVANVASRADTEAQPIRILAIDDQPAILAALQFDLEDCGYQVLTAETSTVGLALAEAERPDFILLDIRMPVMNGLQVLQVLKQDPGTSQIPVIMVTGDGDLSLMQQAFEMGADDYLRKPYNLFELQQRISHAIRSRQSQERILCLEELAWLKESFCSLVSHELRTPLTAILGFSEVLLAEIAGELNAEQRHYQETIQRRSLDLLKLIERLLAMHELLGARRQLDLQETHVPDLLQAAAADILPLFQAGGVRLQVHQRGLGVPVCVDLQALRMILDALLNNAAAFTPKGGRVDLDADGSNGRLVLRVTDTGPGIPTEALATIFEPYRQQEDHRTRAHDGIGLGLALAKRLTELHGGRIWAESQAGKGSTFTVMLPVMAATAGSDPVLQKGRAA